MKKFLLKYTDKAILNDQLLRDIKTICYIKQNEGEFYEAKKLSDKLELMEDLCKFL